MNRLFLMDILQTIFFTFFKIRLVSRIQIWLLKNHYVLKSFVLSALANKLELCKNQLKLLRQPSMYIFQEKNMQSLDLANGA